MATPPSQELAVRIRQRTVDESSSPFAPPSHLMTSALVQDIFRFTATNVLVLPPPGKPIGV